MQRKDTLIRQYTPGSVPIASQAKVYYSADIQRAGGVDAFLESIGSNQEKKLPEIDFSEEEWIKMLSTD